MKLPAAPSLRCVKLLPFAALLAVTPLQSGAHTTLAGFPEDWSHHHVVFSNPGTAAEAAREGRYAEWVRTVSDPRYLLQQWKREANAKANAGFPLPAPESELEVPAEERVSAEGRVHLDTRPHSGVLAAMRGDHPEEPAQSPPRIPPRRRARRSSLQMDWSEDLGTGATLGLGNYPAKFSFSLTSASCATDYAVYNTGVTGTAGQASIVAFNNLYSSCNGGAFPTNYWAYDTNGGAIVTSVTLSLDGYQLAFVQSAAGAASLVVLAWAPNNSESAAVPDVLANTAPASYRACATAAKTAIQMMMTATPCMTAIPFGNLADDTGSSVFYDYGTDVLYVGDDTGNLHKFTGVFAGTPAEVTTSPWPVSVSVGMNALSAPVFDPISGNVLVGDYQAITAPNCGAMGCGYLYKVNASSGAVVQSARLDYSLGIVDGPLVDQTAATVYVFAGADANVNNALSPCGAFQSCSGVIQLSATFSTGATGTETVIGSGKEYMLAGTFDNAYYTSASHASPTGNLYVVGNTAGDDTLYQIPITANVMGAANTGPGVSTSFEHGETAPAMPVTEIYTGTHDYIFTSALMYGAPAPCAPALSTQGCVMGYDVTNGTINSGSTATGATTETGGVSGIIIDTRTNGLVGTSNIYFSTLADQACTGGTGGCAIQTSQASP